MAHELDFSRGSAAFAFAGAKAWHGFGNRLTADAPLETWIEQAGLAYQIRMAAVSYLDAHNVQRMADGRTVLYRDDTGTALGVASDGYKPVQPREVIEFFRSLCADHGLTMETAGALRGGARYFALARTRYAANLTPGLTDTAVMYLLLVSSADCSLSTTALPTAVRVVCANTLSAALGTGAGHVKTSHRTEFDATNVKARLGYTVDTMESQWQTFVTTMQTLNSIPVPSHQSAREFFTALLRPAHERKSAMSATEDRVERATANATADARADFSSLLMRPAGRPILTATPTSTPDRSPRGLDPLMSAYYNAPGAMPGTARGLVEAVTHYVDHIRGTTDAGRMDSAILGQGAQLKARAVDAALALGGR
jgi:phage/plasmid-like protein (TIGR03299 family)